MLSVPLITADASSRRRRAAHELETDVGNLIEPLSPLQFFGIWPDGDFRAASRDHGRDADLDRRGDRRRGGRARVGVAAARVGPSRATSLTASVGCLAIATLGSPWVDAKALATASPAFVFAGARRGGRVFKSPVVAIEAMP